MAILRKIKSATLIEALVATVLIVVIFVVASLILNNLLFNTFSNNTHNVENRMFELEYYARQNKLTLPYNEKFGAWNIEVENKQIESAAWLYCTATNRDSKKQVIKTGMYGN